MRTRKVLSPTLEEVRLVPFVFVCVSESSEPKATSNDVHTQYEMRPR